MQVTTKKSLSVIFVVIVLHIVVLFLLALFGTQVKRLTPTSNQPINISFIHNQNKQPLARKEAPSVEKNNSKPTKAEQDKPQKTSNNKNPTHQKNEALTNDTPKKPKKNLKKEQSNTTVISTDNSDAVIDQKQSSSRKLEAKNNKKPTKPIEPNLNAKQKSSNNQPITKQESPKESSKKSSKDSAVNKSIDTKDVHPLATNLNNKMDDSNDNNEDNGPPPFSNHLAENMWISSNNSYSHNRDLSKVVQKAKINSVNNNVSPNSTESKSTHLPEESTSKKAEDKQSNSSINETDDINALPDNSEDFNDAQTSDTDTDNTSDIDDVPQTFNDDLTDNNLNEQDYYPLFEPNTKSNIIIKRRLDTQNLSLLNSDIPYVQDSQFKQRILPTYPNQALKINQEGEVTFKFTVNEYGMVEPDTIEVITSNSDEFTFSAKSALIKSLFHPKIVDGLPVSQTLLHQYTFNLD